MMGLCRTLARVLVQLEESGYTRDYEKQQATVRQHNDLPARDSESTTAQGLK